MTEGGAVKLPPAPAIQVFLNKPDAMTAFLVDDGWVGALAARLGVLSMTGGRKFEALSVAGLF